MTMFETPKLFRHLWRTVLVWGVLTLLLGVAVLVWPGKSILVAAVLFGVYLVVSGIAQVLFALTLDVSVGSRILMFISGAVSLVLGLLAFHHFNDGYYAILLLAIWIAVGLIFQGVSETVLAISYPGLPGRGWHIVMGIITAIAGIIVLTWPFHSIAVLTIFAGAGLVVIGIAQIVWAFWARKSVHDVKQGIEQLTNAAQ